MGRTADALWLSPDGDAVHGGSWRPTEGLLTASRRLQDLLVPHLWAAAGVTSHGAMTSLARQLASHWRHVQVDHGRKDGDSPWEQ